MEAIVGAAGQYAGARAERACKASRRHRDFSGADMNAFGPAAALNLHPRAHGLVDQPLVERGAVNDGGANAGAAYDDRLAGGAPEAGGGGLTEDGRSRQVEFLERVEAEEPGAVHRLTDLFMFLEQEDVVTLLGEATGRDRPGRARAYHDRIAQIGPQDFVPLASQLREG